MGESDDVFDEMHGFGEALRSPYARYASWFEGDTPSALLKNSREARTFFRRTGITFNVYGDVEADERLIPFDLVPRIIGASECALAVPNSIPYTPSDLIHPGCLECGMDR